MIEAVHIIVGAAIAQNSKNTLFGVTLAFFSHFLFDFIPHIEYPLKKAGKILDTPLSDVIKIGADVLLGFLLIFIFSRDVLLAVAGGFFGMLPDLLTIPFFLFPKNRILKFYYELHTAKIHKLKTKIPLFWRISLQFIAAFLAIYFLAR